jgi:ribosomal protein S18 acetylase RimI-like enzyme
MAAMDLALRRAEAVEAESAADLMWRVREQSLGAIPPSVHPLDDMRRWMRDIVFASFDVWVADAGDEIVGLMVLGRPDWIEHLYIDNRFTGAGLGSRLVALAKQELPEGIQLWTFQSNVGARRFYERHGFVPVQWTDGDNEEGAPDVRFEWRPA